MGIAMVMQKSTFVANCNLRTSSSTLHFLPMAPEPHNFVPPQCVPHSRWVRRTPNWLLLGQAINQSKMHQCKTHGGSWGR